MKIAVTAPIFVKNNEHLHWLNKTTQSIVSSKHDVVFIAVENYVSPDYRPIAYRFYHEPLDSRILPGGEPQSVSKAWNKGINLGKVMGCDYVIVINTDIVFKSNLIDRLVAFAENPHCEMCQRRGEWDEEEIYEEDGEFKTRIVHKICDGCKGTKLKPEGVMSTASEYVDESGLESCTEDENYSEHPNFSCFMVKANFFDNVGMFDENFIPAYVEDGDMHARLALANLKAYVYGGAKFYHKRSNTIQTDIELWNSNANTFPKNQTYFLKKWGHPTVNTVEEMRFVYYKHPFNNEDKPLSYWESPEQKLPSA